MSAAILVRVARLILISGAHGAVLDVIAATPDFSCVVGEVVRFLGRRGISSSRTGGKDFLHAKISYADLNSMFLILVV